jgi:hypothetical protein
MFLASRVRPERKAGNLTAIWEPIFQSLYDAQHITTLEASTTCHADSILHLHYLMWVEYP